VARTKKKKKKNRKATAQKCKAEKVRADWDRSARAQNARKAADVPVGLGLPNKNAIQGVASERIRGKIEGKAGKRNGAKRSHSSTQLV